MKKTKLEKGITLIALIITIVVLLILATVTIGSVQESGIIGHAQNASSEYTIAQEKERIALAYSEYQIEKLVNPDIGELEIEGEDATTEPVGIYGWKVTYEDTGNIYGVNTKGEYDEAVTMIIEAAEATGLGLDCFMIYEDQYAINANKTAGTITMPERYVFYNWSKLTDDEIATIETKYEAPEGTRKVENATDRLCMLDVNGDGYVDKSDSDEVENFVVTLKQSPITMEQVTHNIIANFCIVDKENNITAYDEIYEWCFFEKPTEFVANIDTYSEGSIFLIKFDLNYEYYEYIEASDAEDLEIIISFPDEYLNFKRLYDEHVYYTSGRPSSI